MYKALSRNRKYLLRGEAQTISYLSTRSAASEENFTGAPLFAISTLVICKTKEEHLHRDTALVDACERVVVAGPALDCASGGNGALHVNGRA